MQNLKIHFSSLCVSAR